MAPLTVFTPADNKARTIGRAYESKHVRILNGGLLMMGHLIVLVNLLKIGLLRIIPIKYIYQENQGMHGAYNTAYRNIDVMLNTCIDSDYYMPDDAVEKSIDCWNENGSYAVARIIGLDVTEDEKVIGTKFPDSMKATTLRGSYDTGGKGDINSLSYRRG